jgi:hypothetical protein
MDHHKLLEVSWTVFLIAFGIIKIVVGMAEFILPHSVKNTIVKIPGMKIFFQDDRTIAGVFVFAVLTLYGIVGLLNGLHRIGFYTRVLHRYVGTYMTHCVINSVLGVALVIFYSLVLYTDVNIDKKPSQMENYEVFGLVGGYIFIIFLPVLYLQNTGFNGQMSKHMMILMVLLSILIGIHIYNRKQFIKTLFKY